MAFPSQIYPHHKHRADLDCSDSAFKIGLAVEVLSEIFDIGRSLCLLLSILG